MTTNKVRLINVMSTEQVHSILMAISQETGIPMARLIDEAIWNYPRVKKYAQKHGIERLERRPRGRPSRKPKDNK